MVWCPLESQTSQLIHKKLSEMVWALWNSATEAGKHLNLKAAFRYHLLPVPFLTIINERLNFFLSCTKESHFTKPSDACNPSNLGNQWRRDPVFSNPSTTQPDSFRSVHCSEVKNLWWCDVYLGNKGLVRALKLNSSHYLITSNFAMLKLRIIILLYNTIFLHN